MPSFMRSPHRALFATAMLAASLAVAAQPAPTQTFLSVETPAPTSYGQPIVVRAVVSSTSGTPAGVVVVSDQNQVSCTATLTNGAGTCTLTPSVAGSVRLTGTYSGSEAHAPSTGSTTHDVRRASTTTTITADAPDPSVLTQSITVSVTVTSPAGTPAGTVHIQISGEDSQCTATLVNGSASCSLTPLMVGTRNIRAFYASSSTHEFSVDDEPHVVISDRVHPTTTTITSDRPDPSTPGTPIDVWVEVTSPSGIPTGDVTVTDGETSCVATLQSGVRRCTLTTGSRFGERPLTATYPGTPDFAPSSDTEPHLVLTTRHRGDVNGDRIVTFGDVSILLEAVVGSVVLDADDACAADFDGDGSITAWDASQVLTCIWDHNCPPNSPCGFGEGQ